MLDVACGSGRHVRWMAERGHVVTAVDRDVAALAGLRLMAPGADIVCADLEGGAWPLPGRTFDAVLVTNYLWRPLWPALRDALAPAGVLICETFASGQESIGKPSRPAFLLQPGDLLRACVGLRVVAYEDGFDSATPRFVQRIVAVNETLESSAPRRYPLDAAAGDQGSADG